VRPKIAYTPENCQKAFKRNHFAIIQRTQQTKRLEKSKERPWICISKAARAISGLGFAAEKSCFLLEMHENLHYIQCKGG
jgi:hypothetical protein